MEDMETSIIKQSIKAVNFVYLQSIYFELKDNIQLTSYSYLC